MRSLSPMGHPLCRAFLAVATLALFACGSDDGGGTGGKGGVGGVGGNATGGGGGSGATGGKGGSGTSGGSAGQGGTGGTGGAAGKGGTGGSAGNGGTGGSAGKGGTAGSAGSGGAAGSGGKGGSAGSAGSGQGGAAGSGGSGGGAGTAGAGGTAGGGGAAGTGGSVDAGGGGGNAPDAAVDVRIDARPPDGAGGSDAPPGTCSDAGTSSSASRQTPKILGSTSANKGYLEYLPLPCANTAKPPLMVYFHGIGNNGTGVSASELDKVAANGSPPGLIKMNQWPNARPWVVLSPQQASGCPSASDIHTFIAYAISNYDIDPTRVHLTGLSCGAMGSGQYLAQYGSEQVAAAVLIAGRALPAWTRQGCTLVNGIGLWAFHGDADNVVSIDDDNTAMPQFIACPNPPRKDVRYTVYPGVGHDSWTRTYTLSAGHDIYNWMLGFKK